MVLRGTKTCIVVARRGKPIAFRTTKIALVRLTQSRQRLKQVVGSSTICRLKVERADDLEHASAVAVFDAAIRAAR